MQLEIYHTKYSTVKVQVQVSQSEKAKWNWSVIRNRIKDVENRLVAAIGIGVRKDWIGVWDSRWKLAYKEWINNKVLLYSTGSHIQYPVINHDGKECEKKNVYNWVTFL